MHIHEMTSLQFPWEICWHKHNRFWPSSERGDGTAEVVVVAEAPVPLAADTTFRARRGMGFMPSRLETQGAVGRGLGRLEGASEVPAVASEGWWWRRKKKKKGWRVERG